ncbi:MAG: lasso peptide biosynthesis B2 protein [Gemmatimonadetes bacterium]|nr:lasso peptide biosynthesis B2 protein [Gemmatimonadota bacterium]MCC6774453.1 lasso peptide biosynthesis B2 protein [Gemmatimonadaceae bacterium]
MHAARKLLSVSRREWRDLLVAQWALWRAEWSMKRRPTGALLAEWRAGGGTTAQADPAALPRAREIGNAVRRAALYGITRPKCLARSLAISTMLEREGIDGAIVRIGVRPDDARIAAHAWVEYSGEIVGDSHAHVRSFQLLATANGPSKRP